MTDSVNESKSNPEIGMSEDSFNSDARDTGEGSQAFFDQLEDAVNGGIQEVDTEATLSQPSGPQQVTHNRDKGSNNVASQSNNSTDWQKRYKDSSREAVRWRDRYQQVEQFVPVLEAMKNDAGLVDHVRDYLVNGGKPASSIQEQLGLKPDFQFDPQEAMADPESDSAKLQQAHVDGLVQQRVQEMVGVEKERADIIRQKQKQRTEELQFMKDKGMSPEEFASFKDQASSHTLTLNDVHYLVNRNKNAQNVAQSTRKDMLNQMQNVRNMPTSASGANSQGDTQSPDRNVFDSILGFDDSVDNLFG